MSSSSNPSQESSCSLCTDANQAVEKAGEKSPKRNSLLDWKPIMLIALVLGGTLGLAKSGVFSKTNNQPPTLAPSQSNQSINPINPIEESQTIAPRIGAIAPDFTTTNIFGNPVSLSDFRGQRSVLLIFWATWCGYCAKELPDLKAFVPSYQDQIQVLVIPSRETKDTVSQYAQDNNINFPLLLDERGDIWDTYLARGTPSHFLIDKQGKIVTLWPGLASSDDLETLMTMIPD